MNPTDDRMSDGEGEPTRELFTSWRPSGSARGCGSTAAAVLFVLIMVFSLLLWAGPASHGHLGDAWADGLRVIFLGAPQVAVMLMVISAVVFGSIFALLKDLDTGLRLGAAIVAAVAVFADSILMLYAIAAMAVGMGG